MTPLKEALMIIFSEWRISSELVNSLIDFVKRLP